MATAMSEVLSMNHASTRKSTESILREALAHEGHKVVADRMGFNASNITRLLSGDQSASLKRFCDMIDGSGLKLVHAQESFIETHTLKAMAKICAEHFQSIAQSAR